MTNIEVLKAAQQAGVDCLMAQIKEIYDAWNDQIEVTQELCDSIVA